MPAPQVDVYSVPAWSPDGRSIVVWSHGMEPVSPDRPTVLLVIDVASGTTRAITPIRYAISSVEAPQWSPDGRSIAYHWFGSTRFGAPASQGAAVAKADGSATSPIDAREVTAVAWVPDGSLLQVAYESEAGSMVLATFDPANGALTPVPAQLPAARPGPLAWSPDGKHLAVNLSVGSRAQIAIMNPDGSDARVLDADSTAGDTLAGWSPDGTRVLVTRGDPGVHPTSVWSLGIAAPGDARRETPADLDAFDPVWQALPAL
jgi:Tol biopolymer transport system component